MRPVLLAIGVIMGLTVELRALDASVTVVISEASGQQDFGGGVLISNDGIVLTCYHVVEDAAAIRVFYQNQFYDARVFEISPARDVAKLRLIGASLPTHFLRPSAVLPPNLVSKTMYVVGFAAGLFDQQIPAHATQNAFALSEQLKDQQGKPLFATRGVLVLPMVATIFKGMSGAPVIVGDSVVGVISGSLTQGGSVAWAISVENADDQFMTRVDLPRQGQVWPRLTLMAGGWETLRRQSGVGEDIISDIESLERLASQIGPQLALECSQDRDAVSGLSQLQSLLDGGASDSMSLDSFRAAHEPSVWNSIQTTLDTASSKMKSANSQASTVLESFGGIHDQYKDLTTRVQSFTSTLPETLRNMSIGSSFNNRVRAALEIQGQLIAREEQRKRDQAQIPAARTTVGDYRKTYMAMETNWEGFEDEYCSIIPSFVQSARDISESVRQLLSADLIAASR